MEAINFYPDIRKHASPSSIAMWRESKSAFMKSYFSEEKFQGNASTRAGGVIHSLIENGFLPVKCRYEFRETELRQMYNAVEIFGKADSYGIVDGNALFVDYKSGKENTWDNVTLANDIKMKVTAWLVWLELGQPETLKGFIELIPTKWSDETKEVVWSGEDTQIVAEHTYTKEDMQQVGILIGQVIEEVNAEYIKWGQSTSSYIKEEDIKEYAELQKQIDELEAKQTPIKERIKEQMLFGGLKSYKNDELGTFSITQKKTYKIPEDLLFQVGEKKYTVKEGESIADAMKVVVENYKLTAEPVSVSESIGFRAKKSK